MSFEAMRERLKTHYKANDIKHSGFLTDEEIQDIPVEKVYEWVKTGQWKQSHFKKWLKTMRVI